MQIERRHLEIAEMLRKLMELEDANRAEAAALVRLAVDHDSAAASPSARARPAAAGDGPVGPAAGPDATTSSATAAGGDDGAEAARAGVKRRNPFSRAVSAIRRKFARPQQEAIPAAA